MRKIKKPVAIIVITSLIAFHFSMLTVKAAQQTPEETVSGNWISKTEENRGASSASEHIFHAYIEKTFQGFVVMGDFSDFTPDISRIWPIYSLDGENWQACITAEWHLYGQETNDHLTQICLYDSFEPLKSYLAGTIDRFYLKLGFTEGDGLSHETQAVVIERGELQPVPEGISLMASFSSKLLVRETNPFRYYGKYQITVSAGAMAEDISSFLPDTLPVEVQFFQGKNIVTSSIIDCPVTWKPLSLPPLTGGECITIPDAAEAIVIPGGTRLSTPTGIFQLQEPLPVDAPLITDEVVLVLNVVSEEEDPTGVLTAENSGLEMAFNYKPTGATSIQAYTLTDGGTAWTELPDIPLLQAVNDQPSTANSGYTLVLHKEQEPYRSYLTAVAAGEEPAPFFVGLKIKGGVYDNRQLILAWPDTYACPLDLPEVGGMGGNEGNAGAGNTGNSTESGQRPYLPQDTEETPDQQLPPLGETSDQQIPPPKETDSSSADEAGPANGQNPEGELSPLGPGPVFPVPSDTVPGNGQQQSLPAASEDPAIQTSTVQASRENKQSWKSENSFYQAGESPANAKGDIRSGTGAPIPAVLTKSGEDIPASAPLPIITTACICLMAATAKMKAGIALGGTIAAIRNILLRFIFKQ